MSTEQDLRDRIVSVKKTQKMTGARKMVAAAKFKQVTKTRTKLQAYLDLSHALIQTASGNQSELQWFKPASSPVRWVIIMTGDRGLCGGFNSILLKKAVSTVQKSDDQVYGVGLKSKAFKSTDLTPLAWGGTPESLPVIRNFVDGFLDQYESGQVGKLVVIRQAFVSAIRSDITVDTLMPLVPATSTVDLEYSPSEPVVVRDLVKTYISTHLYNSVIETKAGEEAARMQAMTAATSNAGEMISDLELAYNRARQATITTELTEIVAGAEALN